MGFIKQIVNLRKKATNKKKPSKYKYVTTGSVSQKSKNGKQTKKYAYTRKVYVNGKPRYYYS